jgi:hypothetical protein
VELGYLPRLSNLSICFCSKPSSGWIHAAVLVAVLNVCRVFMCANVSGIVSPVCKEGNIVTSKVGAGVILKTLLNMDIDLEMLPDGDEKGISIETVVPVDGPVKEAVEIFKY